ncbi:uncharacterized protein [Pyrus communis]|uniref:uncharacterized protein isoform X2 n=1 Tax=Pyrus communis TaxID=23211 RepID=UPI0035C1E82B
MDRLIAVTHTCISGNKFISCQFCVPTFYSSWSRWDTYLGNVGMSRLGWRRGLMEVVNQADKIQKENSTSVASNAHGEKYRKPRPTNLKPFRFRTDERGMFKEATLEKKAHAPLKEITLVMNPGAKSTSKHQNVIQVYLGATIALCVV